MKRLLLVLLMAMPLFVVGDADGAQAVEIHKIALEIKEKFRKASVLYLKHVTNNDEIDLVVLRQETSRILGIDKEISDLRSCMSLTENDDIKEYCKQQIQKNESILEESFNRDLAFINAIRIMPEADKKCAIIQLELMALTYEQCNDPEFEDAFRKKHAQDAIYCLSRSE